jgi:hypothetical protein
MPRVSPAVSPARKIPGSFCPSLSKSATTGRSPARPNPNRMTVLPPIRNAQRRCWPGQAVEAASRCPPMTGRHVAVERLCQALGVAAITSQLPPHHGGDRLNDGRRR